MIIQPNTVDFTPPSPLTASERASAAQDYDRVRRAIIFVSEHWRDHPSLEAIADHVGLSPAHFQRLFKRWAGLSPKAFLQALTVDHARALLRDSANVLDTAYEVGLSGPGRLHDLFIEHEAMTPGDFRRRGEGLEIAYGFHDSPFGRALIMATDRGLCGIAFADSREHEAALLADMHSRWPRATYVKMPDRTAALAARIFLPELWRAHDPLNIVFIGTDFEIRVWDALLHVPMGRAVTYSDLASHVCSPRAARAVGSAVGRNPMSFVVPCHRVLAKGGGLGGYHWGVTRKRAILGWEAGVIGQPGD